ncbi:polyprenyl synthetase family protein [Clostridium thermarum]|uniref:polyprenyl synthetase family protein n=1 Tax=Clostridium thermarum TaxID=1716543 RepID=UPI0013D3C62E|nr:polyprenyl synthetase family protein [Clostridium thermarum]
MGKNSLAEASTISLAGLHNIIKLDIEQVFEMVTKEYQYNIPLLESVRYALDVKGKMKRPLLLYLCYLCFKDQIDDNLKYVSSSIEFIHTASLIHDDIIDGGMIRRNRDSLFKKYGIPTSILAGDFLIFLSSRMMANIEDYHGNVLRILNIMNETYCKMCIGQTLEEYLIGNIHVELDKYLEVIQLKTAIFFKCICEAAGLLAGADDYQIQALVSYGINLGIAYQIRDDILGFIETEYTIGKSSNSDAERRLVTLPIILAYRNSSAHYKTLLECHYKNTAPKDISLVRTILNDTNAINETIFIVNQYISEACNSLSILRDSEAKSELISFANSLSIGGY